MKAFIAHELTKLIGMVNINPTLTIKPYQIPVIVDSLVESYKWESVEDFTLCFRRGSAGLYGEIYRLDGAIIGQWMSRYLDEKYDALEQRNAKQKHPILPEKREGNIVDGSKYIKQMLENLGALPSEEKDNSKENAYQKFKLEYLEKQKAESKPEDPPAESSL